MSNQMLLLGQKGHGASEKGKGNLGMERHHANRGLGGTQRLEIVKNVLFFLLIRGSDISYKLSPISYIFKEKLFLTI